MTDVALAVKHFRYAPKDHVTGDDLPPGIYQNPFAGEVVTGEVVEVRADQSQSYVSSNDWEKSNQKDYDKQPSHGELIDQMRQPVDNQEE